MNNGAHLLSQRKRVYVIENGPLARQGLPGARLGLGSRRRLFAVPRGRLEREDGARSAF